MNLPNKITIFRVILFIPLTIFLSLTLFYKNQETFSFDIFNDNLSDKSYSMIFFIVSLIIFIIAMISDFIDGYLARKNNLVTDFGKLFDPLSDKIIVGSTMLFLVLLETTFWYLFLIFFIRDLVVDGFRNIAAKNNISISASIYGKLKTLIQSLGIIIIFISAPFLYNKNEFINLYIYIINIPMYVASVLSLVSGYFYVKKIYPYIKSK